MTQARLYQHHHQLSYAVAVADDFDTDDVDIVVAAAAAAVATLVLEAVDPLGVVDGGGSSDGEDVRCRYGLGSLRSYQGTEIQRERRGIKYCRW